MSFYDLSNEYDINKSRNYLELLIKNKDVAELRKKPENRTNKQNAYIHMAFGIMSTDSGYTLEEMKSVVKRSINFTYEKNGQKFLRQTRDLSSQEMTVFIEDMRKWAATEGFNLLSPEEYEKNQAGVDAYCHRNRV